jgi:hypothetical protein
MVRRGDKARRKLNCVRRGGRDVARKVDGLEEDD